MKDVVELVPRKEKGEDGQGVANQTDAANNNLQINMDDTKLY